MPDTDTATITLPCPPWCAQPAGHQFDNMRNDGATTRFHVRDLDVEVPVSSSRGDRHAVGALVSIAQEEAVTGHGVEWGPVEISIPGYEEGDGLTGPAARQLAGALLDAADEWDRVSLSAT